MSDTALNSRLFGKVRTSFLSQKQGDVVVPPTAAQQAAALGSSGSADTVPALASSPAPTATPATAPTQTGPFTAKADSVVPDLPRFGSQSPQSLASVRPGLTDADRARNQENMDLFEKILDEMDAENPAPVPEADVDADTVPAPAATPAEPVPVAEAPIQPTPEPAPVAQEVPVAPAVEPVAEPAADAYVPSTTAPVQGSAHKENLTVNPALAVESATAPVVEYEVPPEKPEISPEVSSFLEHIESHQEQIPQEIVIADAQEMVMPPKPIAQPVIVLPITPEEEKAGQGKSVNWSVRWLVEWSRKIMKIFSGKVIYREEPKEEVAV